MKALTAIAAAAAVVLTGCGTAATTSGTQTGAAATHTATALTCSQQFKAWKDGPAKAVGKQMVPALKKVQTIAGNQDIPELNSALKDLGNIAKQLTAYPMPACADPKGYWTQMLGYLKAAGDNASASTGLAGLLSAMAPLAKIAAVQGKLDAEIKQSTGAS